MANDKKPVAQNPKPQATNTTTQPTASYGTKPVRDNFTPTASYGTKVVRNSGDPKPLTRLVKPKP